MNRVFFVPNYHTLFTAYCMSEKLINRGDKSIILTYGFIEPSIIYDAKNIKFIKMERCKKKSTTAYKIMYYCKNLNNMINQIEYKSDENFEFYFFLDQEVEMQVAQAIVKNRFPFSKIFMVEEGLSLYWHEYSAPELNFIDYCKQKSLYKAIRRLVTKGAEYFVKLQYGCKIYRYIEAGTSLYIDEIICKYPSKLHPDVISRKKICQQDLQLYNVYNSRSFLYDIFHINLEEIKVDYLYLGGPYTEEGVMLGDEEKRFIWKLLDSLPTSSNVTIKPHGADSIGKYNEFTTHNLVHVNVLDALYYLPVESLYFLLGCPIILSPFSSALLEIKTTYSQSEGYALLNLANFRTRVDETMFTDLRLIVPQSWEDFINKVNVS